MKKDIVYKVVTDSLIKQLTDAIDNEGNAPWDKPWSAYGGTPMAIRKFNGKTYRGINVWILLGSGRPGPWLTYKQAEKAGGKIKQEETKNYQVISFWKINKYPDKTNLEKNVHIPMLRYYRVYSLEQTEGVKEPKWLTKEKEEKAQADSILTDPFDKAKQIWIEFKGKPDVVHGNDRAYYTPQFDRIHMPEPSQFVDKSVDQVEGWAHYYSTLFHEGAHSTGHPNRLNRFDKLNSGSMFGSESYSKEELVAEMTAAYLQAFAGIEVKRVRDNNVAYLKSWISRLEKDPRLAVQAASQAQKACDHILGIRYSDVEENASDVA